MAVSNKSANSNIDNHFIKSAGTSNLHYKIISSRLLCLTACPESPILNTPRSKLYKLTSLPKIRNFVIILSSSLLK